MRVLSLCFAAAAVILASAAPGTHAAASSRLGRMRIPGLDTFHKQQLDSILSRYDAEQTQAATGGSFKVAAAPLTNAERATAQAHRAQQAAKAVSATTFPSGNITTPLDHFDASNEVTFPLRYFVNTRHYVPPAQRKDPKQPTTIIVLDSGETAATDRLSFLDHGIVDILANATNGIGIVLENRYYGTSIPLRSQIEPVAEGWDSDGLRYLNYTQSLEDNAFFARNFKLPGFDEDLRAGLNKTRWVIYGGSLAGARAVHTRVRYPDLYQGAIGSSAVVKALDFMPEYWSAAARALPANCSNAQQTAVHGFDSIAVPLAKAEGKHNASTSKARTTFLETWGAPNLTRVLNLASLLTAGLENVQALNWDPTIGESASSELKQFCSDLTSATGANADKARQLQATGIKAGQKLPTETYRLAAYLRTQYIDPCVASPTTSANQSAADACLGDPPAQTVAPTDPEEIAYTWSACLNFGWEQGGPQPGMPFRGPRVASQLVDLKYLEQYDCSERIVPGKVFNLPSKPIVSEYNELGGFKINMDGIGFVDGQCE